MVIFLGSKYGLTRGDYQFGNYAMPSSSSSSSGVSSSDYRSVFLELSYSLSEILHSFNLTTASVGRDEVQIDLWEEESQHGRW